MIGDLLSLVDDASPLPHSGFPASTPDRDHNDDDDSRQDDDHHYHEDDDHRHNCIIESVRTCLQGQELAILGPAEANLDTSREGTGRCSF